MPSSSARCRNGRSSSTGTSSSTKPQEYTPHHDWSRTNGLLEDVRQAYLGVEEQKALDELTRPKEMKKHEPGQPLEMPRGGASGTTSDSDRPAPAPNMNINAPGRSVEKVEK